MQVTWDENVCIHAGKCVGGAPEVFKVEDGQFQDRCNRGTGR